MAGDWIKMRGNLWDDPRVASLCDLTDSTEGPVIGALYWLWAAADQHTEDGFMPGLTLRQIDRKTGLQGFGAALCSIGWLEERADGVTIVKFSDHNGQSAKRRCSDAQRKATVRNVSASDADKKRTDAELEIEEEKRREEEKQRLERAQKAREDEEREAAERQRALLEAEGHKPTPAGAICKAMKSAGLQAVNQGDPRLLAMIAQGATLDEFVGAAADAVSKQKGFAWALTALAGKRTDAQALKLAPPADGGPTAWHETQGGVDAMASRLGLPKWDGCTPWRGFRKTIVEAAEAARIAA